jgi:hypothetical protein
MSSANDIPEKEIAEIIAILQGGPDVVSSWLCARMLEAHTRRDKKSMGGATAEDVPIRTVTSIKPIIAEVKKGSIAVAALLELLNSQHLLCKANMYALVWDQVLQADVITSATVRPGDLLLMQRMCMVKPFLVSQKNKKGTSKVVSYDDVEHGWTVFYKSAEMVLTRWAAEYRDMGSVDRDKFGRFLVEAQAYHRDMGRQASLLDALNRISAVVVSVRSAEGGFSEDFASFQTRARAPPPAVVHLPALGEEEYHPSHVDEVWYEPDYVGGGASTFDEPQYNFITVSHGHQGPVDIGDGSSLFDHDEYELPPHTRTLYASMLLPSGFDIALFEDTLGTWRDSHQVSFLFAGNSST